VPVFSLARLEAASRVRLSEQYRYEDEARSEGRCEQLQVVAQDRWGDLLVRLDLTARTAPKVARVNCTGWTRELHGETLT
jgi:hypothetical protein